MSPRQVTLTPADMTAEEVKATLFGPVKKGNKFGAQKTTVDGATYDSKGEASWYQGLIARQKAGEIRNLRRQVKYPLWCGTVRICDYVADAAYQEVQDDFWPEVVADYKGVLTPVCRLKAKLFLANVGMPITCVDSKGKATLVPHIPKARTPRKETQA